MEKKLTDLYELIRENGYNSAIVDVLNLIPEADYQLYCKVMRLYKIDRTTTEEEKKTIVNVTIHDQVTV